MEPNPGTGDDVVLMTYDTVMDAEMAAQLLMAHGIKCLIQPKGLHSGGIPNNMTGADLVVLEKDKIDALAILEIEE